MVEDYDLTNSEWIGVGGGGWGTLLKRHRWVPGLVKSQLWECAHTT